MADRTRLSAEERSLLQRWVNASGALTARAKVILGFDAGQSVRSICEQSGLSRCAVFGWRKRFHETGIDGIASKAILDLTAAERDELEAWKSAGGLLASRATVIFELAETFNVARAARLAGVSLYAARRWRALFNNGGMPALRPAINPGRCAMRPLSDGERACLLDSAKAAGALGKRAQCLIAAADGEPLGAVAVRFGIPVSKVVYWCRRFARAGIGALAPAQTRLFTAAQLSELEWLSNAGPSHVAPRAAVLLDMARARHSEHAAAKSATIKRWIRAYKKMGSAGLATTDPTPPRRHMPKAGPLNLNLRMKGQIRLESSPGELLTVPGESLTVSHQHIEIVLEEPPQDTLSVGRVVSGIFAWPVLRDGNERVVLSIRGFVVDAAPRAITVKVRLATLERAGPRMAW